MVDSSSFQATFGNMTDSQLRQTITELSTAAASDQFMPYSPMPQDGKAKSKQPLLLNVER